MYKVVKRRWIETVVYLLFWGVLILNPFWALLLSGGASQFSWDNAVRYWLFLCPALLLFGVNNCVLMPFLLYQKKKRQYLLYLILLITFCFLLFILLQNMTVEERKPTKPYWDKVLSVNNGVKIGAPPDGKRAPKMFCRAKYVYASSSIHYFFTDGENKIYKVRKNIPRDRHSLSFFHPYSVQMLLIVFVLAFNICVRLFFNTVRNDERLIELEAEKLRVELDYLKYQINPHFFMNTLNNIHALIDIDKSKAQSSIMELSKMMRYVLYESSNSCIPLEKEIQFLTYYIALMRLRYTDKLKVSASFPMSGHRVSIPPLLFIPFLENAFKHGVSYNRDSEIDVRICFEDKSLIFLCKNTMNARRNDKRPGIGVENVKKRLELLYNNEFVLDIKCDEIYYNVLLKIPIADDKMYNC